MKEPTPNNEPISDENERKFWGIHAHRDHPDGIGCLTCGWGPNDPIHRV